MFDDGWRVAAFSNIDSFLTDKAHFYKRLYFDQSQYFKELEEAILYTSEVIKNHPDKYPGGVAVVKSDDVWLPISKEDAIKAIKEHDEYN